MGVGTTSEHPVGSVSIEWRALMAGFGPASWRPPAPVWESDKVAETFASRPKSDQPSGSSISITLVYKEPLMPGSQARMADIYSVGQHAISHPDPHAPRPTVCVAELPCDPQFWRGMSRTTTGGGAATELASPANASLGLTKSGWWTLRFVRPVKKRYTGQAGICDYIATIPEPEKTAVLNHYRNRSRT